jgi:hypothetical protein
MIDGLVRGKICQKSSIQFKSHHKSFIFKILNSWDFVVTLSHSMTSASLLDMAILFVFAAIMAKRDCKLICFGCGQEKTMAKSKKTSQHHKTQSSCCKSLM